MQKNHEGYHDQDPGRVTRPIERKPSADDPSPTDDAKYHRFRRDSSQPVRYRGPLHNYDEGSSPRPRNHAQEPTVGHSQTRYETYPKKTRRDQRISDNRDRGNVDANPGLRDETEDVRRGRRRDRRHFLTAEELNRESPQKISTPRELKPHPRWTKNKMSNKHKEEHQNDRKHMVRDDPLEQKHTEYHPENTDKQHINLNRSSRRSRSRKKIEERRGRSSSREDDSKAVGLRAGSTKSSNEGIVEVLVPLRTTQIGFQIVDPDGKKKTFYCATQTERDMKKLVVTIETSKQKRNRKKQ